MTHPISQIIVLLVVGAIALIIGGYIQMDPVAFYAGTGIELGNQTALKNELKAAAGFLLTAGFLALLAAAITQLRTFALTTLVLINGTYGGARILSFLADGVPNAEMVWIAGIELALAAACAAVLIRAMRTLNPMVA
ncbi:DUF4345 family protein [Roseovarius sp. Pro17]|uniref:DUF4345 family protein n=1 Tax=Roseovarius sp. Pro17 TaxID=3108175 RepID=UPI002D772D88|nr:DUF4345 family protein [Roseovarius sp. Pro17]